MPEASINPEEVDRQYAALQANAVPVNAVSLELLTNSPHRGRLTSVVYLDCSQRPDVGDLVRVHKMEGEGHIKTRWGLFKTDEKIEISLQFVFDAPVTCEFTLLFQIQPPIPQMWDWLTYTDQEQLVCLANGDGPEPGEQEGVFVELNGQRLINLLTGMIPLTGFMPPPGKPPEQPRVKRGRQNRDN